MSAPTRETRDKYGLIDFYTSTDLTPRWPTTVRGWLSLAVGTLLCDVLRRCSYEGCWRRAKYGTLLSGRMCSECYADYYGMNDA